MYNLALLLFIACWITFYLWLSPQIRRDWGKKRWESKEAPKPKEKSRKKDEVLEQSLTLLNISPQKFRLWNMAAMGGCAFYEFLFTRDLTATLFYALVGRMLIRTYVALIAAHRQQMQDAQTLQFVRGLKENLGIEGNLVEAVRTVTHQLREPLRGELILALNSARGNRTLPEAIHELGLRIKNPVYTKLSRIMEKGLNEGQKELAFAFAQEEKSLREGEKLALKRAGKIRSFLMLLAGFFAFGAATPILELVFRSDVWRETTGHVYWAWSIGALLDLFLASGLKKFTRLYVRRGGLTT